LGGENKLKERGSTAARRPKNDCPIYTQRKKKNRTPKENEVRKKMKGGAKEISTKKQTLGYSTRLIIGPKEKLSILRRKRTDRGMERGLLS